MLHRFTFRAMAAENEVQVHAGDEALAETIANAAIAEVKRIEAKYSRYLADSVVSRINAAAGADAVAVDEETMALLAFADACFRQSDGLFDATSGVLRRAWNFKEAHVPWQSELDALLPLVGWQNVEVSDAQVRLAKPGMQLDFGGFGKEYAVDRAARVMRERGAESAMVNLAGDLAILGPKPMAHRGAWAFDIRASKASCSPRFPCRRARSRQAGITSGSSKWTASAIATSWIRARAARRGDCDR